MRGVNIRALNNSWGGQGTCTPYFKEAISLLDEAGIMFITAAGNNGGNNDIVGFTPSACQNSNTISYCCGKFIMGDSRISRTGAKIV